MDSLIRETNENLNVILSTLKNNLDNSESILENIQINMDKKVEEAKKYKIQVVSAKDKIRELEDDNKSLELSLKELNDRYGKMNLVSLVETGNKEIKTKINENNKEINRQKELIADLTNKARTIKDLLINLKKDKTIKEERLENLKTVYNYYEIRINEIIDFAFNHSENLSDYKSVSYNIDEQFDNVEINNSELENTMIFDEIANIDENKNFKDEMTFIDGQIDETYNDDIEDEVKVIENDMDSTQVFNSIINEEDEEDEEESNPDNEELIFDNSDLFIQNEEKTEKLEENIPDLNLFNNNEVDTNLEENKEETNLKDIISDTEDKIEEDYKTINNLDVFNISDIDKSNDTSLLEEIDDNEERISKINDLFTSIDNTKTSNIPTNKVSGIENEIDNAYKDIFGVNIDEKDLNKTVTLTDIFGNPIKNEEISEDIKKEKKIEELFVENGIVLGKFKEDEQNYLKQIYDEEKFNNILSTLNRNKINIDNLYHACNIFGEISANELEGIINLLISSGQTVEAVGLILEKLPKVKKYNLSEAINSYGDYVKDVDITELIMKAKDLYDGGNK